MKNRAELVQEFMQLKVQLDRTNPKPNMKTELKFSFRKSGEVLQLIAQTLEIGNFFVLCVKQKDQDWADAGSAGFSNLKEFCIDWLDQNAKNKNLSDPNIAKEVAEELRRILTTLFIPKDDS